MEAMIGLQPECEHRIDALQFVVWIAADFMKVSDLALGIERQFPKICAAFPRHKVTNAFLGYSINMHQSVFISFFFYCKNAKLWYVHKKVSMKNVGIVNSIFLVFF